MYDAMKVVMSDATRATLNEERESMLRMSKSVGVGSGSIGSRI